jgi:hypothetical protein
VGQVEYFAAHSLGTTDLYYIKFIITYADYKLMSVEVEGVGSSLSVVIPSIGLSPPLTLSFMHRLVRTI